MPTGTNSSRTNSVLGAAIAINLTSGLDFVQVARVLDENPGKDRHLIVC